MGGENSTAPPCTLVDLSLKILFPQSVLEFFFLRFLTGSMNFQWFSGLYNEKSPAIHENIKSSFLSHTFFEPQYFQTNSHCLLILKFYPDLSSFSHLSNISTPKNILIEMKMLRTIFLLFVVKNTTFCTHSGLRG